MSLTPVRQTNGFEMQDRRGDFDEGDVMTPVGVNESRMEGRLTQAVDSVEQEGDVQVVVSNDCCQLLHPFVVETVSGCEDVIRFDQSSSTEVEPERIQETNDPWEGTCV